MPALPQDKFHRPLRDLRISLTDRCNLRCTYCMPAELFGPDFVFLPKKELLSYEELLRLVSLFAQLGVIKIRLTGGEPLLRKDLDSFISKLTQVEGIEDIALTTNGVLLEKLAEPLKNAGLQRVTVSLDGLSDKIFQQINGKSIPTSRVLNGIEAATQVGLAVKVNMVVIKGSNDHELLPMARYFKEKGIPLRFIEYMDVGNQNGWKMKDVYPAKMILDDIANAFPLEALEPNYQGEVARRYRYEGTDTEIGIISSVTQPFCQNCNRARISANGSLFTCLFANSGHDLRPLLRSNKSDKEIMTALTKMWSKREDRYSEIRTEVTRNNKVEMNFIGG